MSTVRTMENDIAKVEVCDFGAELFSFYDKETKVEAVWQADPKYWARHAPVLFPFVGKVNGGYYTHKGVQYAMGQHGFARDMEFEFVAQTDNEIVHVLKSNDETMAKYPFAFEFKVTHKLEGKKLSVIWEVTNPGEEIMYFSVGGHPAFNVPARAGESKYDYFVTFNGEKELKYILIDLSCAAANVDDVYTLKLEDNKLPITEHLFDNDALIFDDYQVEKIGIAYPDGTPYLTMECKGFPSMGVWSQPKTDAPFVCLEPWIGRVDNRGFAGELKDKYYEQSVEAGKTFKAQYDLTLG